MANKDPDKERAYQREYKRRRRKEPEFRERAREIDRARYGRDRDKRLAASKAYREKHRDRIADYLRDYYSANRERWLKYAADKYAEEREAIGGAGNCAICGTKDPGKRNWQRDHDHANGQWRGILCHNCNVGLGHFKDNPERLIAAVGYLAYWRGEHANVLTGSPDAAIVIDADAEKPPAS